jgi:hypothetical protein
LIVIYIFTNFPQLPSQASDYSLLGGAQSLQCLNILLMNSLPCLKIINFLHILLLFTEPLAIEISKFLTKSCQGLMSSILNSSIEGSLGCSVIRMLNHMDSIAELLLIQHHLHTPYWGTSTEWSPCADVEGCVVVAVRLE